MRTFNRPARGLFLAGISGVAVAALYAMRPGPGDRYLGAGKCKQCHQSAKSGNRYAMWASTHHAGAWGTLATDQAKTIGATHGVENPQASERCAKCHVTAYGAPSEKLYPGFDPTLGVQCESCHGPGERHFQARLAAAGDEADDGTAAKGRPAARTPLPEGEIVADPPLHVCLGCHNREAPVDHRKCLADAFQRTMHTAPCTERTEAELAAKRKEMEDELKAQKAWCAGPETCEACRKAKGN